MICIELELPGEKLRRDYWFERLLTSWIEQRQQWIAAYSEKCYENVSETLHRVSGPYMPNKELAQKIAEAFGICDLSLPAAEIIRSSPDKLAKQVRS